MNCFQNLIKYTKLLNKKTIFKNKNIKLDNYNNKIKCMSNLKRILGLDLGTNSIGWALIEQDFENKQGEILGMGSRIIPMDAAIMGEFDKGNSISQTAERTD